MDVMKMQAYFRERKDDPSRSSWSTPHFLIVPSKLPTSSIHPSSRAVWINLVIRGRAGCRVSASRPISEIFGENMKIDENASVPGQRREGWGNVWRLGPRHVGSGAKRG